jgi:NAD(P)-dependent dehydrogenase (short-subunit alcohol dehydrogenase family)
VFELDQKVALVTGAGQNVGAGIARVLAAQGAAVAVNDVRPERAEAVVAAVEEAGGRAAAVAFDVTDYDAVVAGVATAEAALGPVDILVNNAGNGGEHGMRPTQFRESDPASWRGPIDVNLYGVMHCSRAVINGMVERGRGRIITIASGAGTIGLNIGVAPYAGGKGGAIGFMRHLAMETAKSGVTANTLALGMMASPGNLERIPAEQVPKLNPIGRFGTGRDVGTTVVWLAAEGSWITGQTIQVNGGASTT